MKKLVMSVLCLVVVSAGFGCGTPAYSGRERFRQIGRNWDYEWKQMRDDIDHALLLRPASRLTVWNVR